jgi:hypothetical protein
MPKFAAYFSSAFLVKEVSSSERQQKTQLFRMGEILSLALS